MDYKLDTKIYPWVKAFMAVSISQFSQVSDKLDFPFPIKRANHIQVIAHDFAFTYAMLTKNPEHKHEIERLIDNPETSPIDVLKGLPTNASLAEKRDTLFTNTFTALEQIGYADELYLWCRTTLAYYKLIDNRKYQEIQSLNACFHLLRHWAVRNLLEKSDTDAQYKADWRMLIEYYSPIIFRPIFPPFTDYTPKPLLLSDDTSKIFREIILDYEAQKFQLEIIMDQVMIAPKSLWDDFALRNWGSDSWIRLEGDNRLNQNAWIKIENTLSPNDMYQIKQWIIQHKDYFSGRNLPFSKTFL